VSSFECLRHFVASVMQFRLRHFVACQCDAGDEVACICY
jgi:hypothetical protein